MMMNVADTFRALGDPLRLIMVERLANGEPSTITTVCEGLGVTRQGARKHLQVLADAKIVALEQKGRDVYVRLEPESLVEVKGFIEELEERWDRRLDALRAFVEGTME